MEEILDRHKEIIKNHEIITWDSEPVSYRFKANVYLINDSQLIIKDYLFLSGRKYTFHWQNKDGSLITRWDNAPQWKGIATFPHHKHKKEGVFYSEEVTLDGVLDYIYLFFKTCEWSK